MAIAPVDLRGVREQRGNRRAAIRPRHSVWSASNPCPEITRKPSRESGSAFCAFDKPIFNDQLLQRGQSVDPAVTGWASAWLDDFIGGLLDECPQLRRIHVPEFAYDQSG